MTVATERVFRSDETPKTEAGHAEHRGVTVRAYKVDLETYFRKMHLARGVEGLDIALIDPDTDVRVQGAQLRQAPGVGEPDRGAAAASARQADHGRRDGRHRQQQDAGGHDAGDPERPGRDRRRARATRCSCSPRTCSPASRGPACGCWSPTAGRCLARARPGKTAFSEELQDWFPPHRTLRLTRRPLEGRSRPTTPTTSACSPWPTATWPRTWSSLQGVGVAHGLADKGYIYTDRPAYRAGQLVHVRGCLRHAADDAYTIEKDKKYTVEVFDAATGCSARSRSSSTPSAASTPTSSCPPTSPQGQYRVLVHDDAAQNYQGTFLVHEYQLEPIRLVVDTPRTGLLPRRGDRGHDPGRVLLRGPAGRPRDPLPIGRRPPAHRHHRRQGRGPIQAAHPRVQRDAGPAAGRSQLPERNVQHAVNFVLAAQGFSIGVSTVRPVYVAGETFEATRQRPRRRGQAAGPEADAQGAGADRGRGQGRASGSVEEHPI